MKRTAAEAEFEEDVEVPIDDETENIRTHVEDIDTFYRNHRNYEDWLSMKIPDPRQLSDRYRFMCYLEVTWSVSTELLSDLLQRPLTRQSTWLELQTIIAISDHIKSFIMESYSHPDLCDIFYTGEGCGSTVAVDITMVWAVLYTAINFIKSVNVEDLTRLRENTLPLAYLYDLHESDGVVQKTSYLANNAAEIAPTVYKAGLLLWPHDRISYYTQTQLIQQLDLLSFRWNEIELYDYDTDLPQDPDCVCVYSTDLHLLLNNILTRFAEICCCGWEICSEFYMHPSYPLDGGDKLVIAYDCGMIPDNYRKKTVNEKTIYDSILERKKTASSSTDVYSVNRRYVNCFLARFTSLYRIVMYVTQTIHYDLLSHKGKTKILDKLTRKAIESIITITDDIRHQCVFEMISRKCRKRIWNEANGTAESSIEDMQKTARFCYVRPYFQQEHAYENNFIVSTESHVLENSVGYRISISCMQSAFPRLKPVDFLDKWWPCGMRFRAVVKFIRSIFYAEDQEHSWESENLAWDSQLLGNYRDYDSLPMMQKRRSAPFIVQLMGNVYVGISRIDLSRISGVRRKNQEGAKYVRMKSMEDAFVLWLMLMVVNHDSKYMIGMMTKEMPYLRDIFLVILTTET
ncbi:MAG: hypothetical protein JSS82_12490 [Bacteroidetes bacterium]|nr:hypothetical protein [Bacteroidota bacterium]